MPAVVRAQLDAPENWARLTRTTLDLNGSYVYTNRRVEQVEAQRVLSWPAAEAGLGGRAGIRGLKDRAPRGSILGSRFWDLGFGIGLPRAIHLPFKRSVTCLTSL